MDFLGIGPTELMIILVVALLVFGPEKIVDIARTLGRISRRISQAGKDFTRTLEEEAKPLTEATHEFSRSIQEQAKAVGQASNGAMQTLGKDANTPPNIQKDQVVTERQEHDRSS